MNHLRLKFLPILVGALLWLPAGCGYKGALYLPTDAEPSITHTVAYAAHANN